MMAASDIRIEPVVTQRDLNEFIMFPFELYKSDPYWVPPLISERKTYLNQQKNPFFEHAEAQLFRAVRGGETIGTIVAIADELHPKIWNEPVGFFGIFEVIEEYEVAAKLLSAAREWLAARGREVMRGPMNLNINDECGLLIDGFDGTPVIMMTAFGSKEIAMEAIRMGAYDYFTKPFDINELRVVVKRALEKQRLEGELRKLKEELDEKLSTGKFLGVKSYLANVPDYIPGDEIRIFDIFPHHQLELLNAQAKIVMLHIPRSGRLKDPVNLAQMIELDKRYPNIKTIIAHVGRAYCPDDIGNAFDVLKKTENILFDISANTCADTFEAILKAIGPKRILFGSDLPIARMRMKRICENGKYINLVPKGLYGDVSDDPNMREVSADESKDFTFFMYEELLAFKKAAQKANLSADDIENVFYNNDCPSCRYFIQKNKRRNI